MRSWLAYVRRKKYYYTLKHAAYTGSFPEKKTKRKESNDLIRRKLTACAPDGGFEEAFVGEALAEDVQVTAGAERRQETEPLRRVDEGVERGQERMIQHFQNFPLCPRSAFLVPPRQVLLLHHLRREHRAAGSSAFLGHRQVDGAHVAGAEAAREVEVGEGEGALEEGGRVGLGVGEWGVEVGGGWGGGWGAEACAAFDFCGGGSEAEAVEVVGEVLRLHGFGEWGEEDAAVCQVPSSEQGG